MYVFEFTERRLPQTINQSGRQHWAAKVAASREWNNIVMYHVLKKGGPPNGPLPRAKLTLIRYSSREPDFDGLVSSFKVVIDALRYNGVILDDKMSNVGVPSYSWVSVKPREGSIYVRVEGVLDDALSTT